MKHFKHFALTVLLALVGNLQVSAYEFSAVNAGKTIYYNITSSTEQTCEVTYETEGIKTYSGDVVIPSTVNHAGKTYNVTGIGKSAFNNCTGLTSLKIPRSITYIKSEFSDFYNYLSDVNFTKVEIEDLAAWCNIDFSGLCANPFYGNAIMYKPRKLYLNGSEVTDLSGMTNVEEIKPFAFAFMNFTSLNIPEGVKKIGLCSFGGNYALTEVHLPKSLTDIEGSFPACPGLQQISVAADNNSFCTKDGVLYSKDELTLVVWPETKHDDNTITIPEGVKFIGTCAFNTNGTATSIYLPNRVFS